MSLKQDIKTFRDEALSDMQPHVLKTLRKGVDDLVADKIEKNALGVGDTLPLFVLPDANGKSVSSKSILEKGALIVSFYRGGWCPYCNLELRALQKLLPEFEANNATLVAISPEKPDNSLSTQEKNDLRFSVVSDSNNNVARSLGLVFEVPQEVIDISKSEFALDYRDHNGTDKHELPIPATYVIGTDGIIRFAFVNPDYTKRAEPSEILRTVASLNKEKYAIEGG